MITDPKLLIKMFFDYRPYRGLSEFRFRPRVRRSHGMNAVDIEGDRRCFTAWLRPSTSDGEVFNQVFLADDYNLRRFGNAFYDRIVSVYERSPKPLILDLGANIGLSSLYFANNFERAHIIAVEPDPSNFAVLERNISGLPRITGVNAAIASHDGRADVIQCGGNASMSRTKISCDGVVSAVCVKTILDSHPKAQPFIVKIDIEGAEEELFSTNLDWVDRFPVLIIEPHDWMIPGRANSKNFLNAICGKDRDFLVYSENVYSIAVSQAE